MDRKTDKDEVTDNEAAEMRASLKEQKRRQLEDKEAQDETNDILDDLKKCNSIQSDLVYLAMLVSLIFWPDLEAD